MMNSRLKVGVMSDVHLGHDKTKTEFIVENLLNAFPDNETTGELDLIWIAGDLFDRLLSFPTDSVTAISSWAYRFLTMCAKRDIVVRVLEGTPSHDWKQPKFMVEVNENAGIGADLKYLPELCIEHIERFGINVLYVPDEWRAKNIDTWVEVQDLLKEHNLEKVDFSIMHGCFTYQIPPNIVDMFETHDAENYLGITRYLIFIGHIHQHSQYKRIMAAGSFDRLRHGEEEDKGHIRATIEPDGNYTATFVVNSNAKRYITLDYTKQSLDDVYRQLDALVSELPEDSHIRLQADTDDAVFRAGSDIKNRYKNINLSFKSNQRKQKIEPIVTREVIKSVNLSPSTILTMMEASLNKNHAHVAKQATSVLKEIIDEYGT